MSTKRRIFFLVLSVCLLSSMNLKAQSDMTDLFKAGASDLQTLAEGYVKPLGYGFSTSLGNNWYNTAQTHKLLGFDLTVGVSGAFTPAADKTFSLTGFKNLSAVNHEPTAPTFGGKGDGVLLSFKDNNGKEVTRFTTPKGVTNIIPAPSLQLTLGLPAGNDLAVRLVPTIDQKDFKGNMWGIGLKHDIGQWFELTRCLPFKAAVMVGYSKFNLDYHFDTPIIPTDLVDDPNTVSTPSGVSYDNQGMKLRVSALMANVIISKDLLFFAPYLGVGITSSTFDFNFTGNFPTLGNFNSGTGKYDVNTLTDPIPLHYTKMQPGATVGFRLKLLWIFALHAQYTLQKYSTASVGFGLNIR